MPSITVTRRIAASPERVWEIITDLPALPTVVDSIIGVERLDDLEGFVPGTRWRETRKILGRQATEEMEVSSVDPGRSFTVEAESHGAEYTTTHLLEPFGNGTDVTLTFMGTPVSAVARILGTITAPLLRSATRKALSGDLAAIAAVAEG